MFFRFVIQRIDSDSLNRTGAIRAAHLLKGDSTLPDADREALESLLDWFDDNLPSPARFNRTKSKGYYRRRAIGLSWLKSAAHDHLSRMRELCKILQRHGHFITLLKEARPGYVLYEDEYQVVAEPFADTAK